jgi:hypothetical protein
MKTFRGRLEAAKSKTSVKYCILTLNQQGSQNDSNIPRRTWEGNVGKVMDA